MCAKVIERTKSNRFFSQSSPILFIDEIHLSAASRKQTLCSSRWTRHGNTHWRNDRESVFEVIRPPLRCQLYVLKSLEKEDLLELLWKEPFKQMKYWNNAKLRCKKPPLCCASRWWCPQTAHILELVVESETENKVVINRWNCHRTLAAKSAGVRQRRRNALRHHLGFHQIDSRKWPRRCHLLVGAYGGRRWRSGFHCPPTGYFTLNIGLANPNALLLATACFDTLMKIGWPEGRIPLAETTIYLATSPKSNSAYMAINSAIELVRETGNLPVPLHLRNAPTKLMKQLGYGQNTNMPTVTKAFCEPAVSARRGEGASYMATAKQCGREQTPGADEAAVGWKYNNKPARLFATGHK